LHSSSGVNNCPGKAIEAIVDSIGTVVGMSAKHEYAVANPLNLNIIFKTSKQY